MHTEHFRTEGPSPHMRGSDSKTELIKPLRSWKTLSDVELATAEYVDWYNHRRLHGEIGHVPPVEYETNHYLATAKPQVRTNI
ncbi:IS3 family transposase [Streptomyces sp. NPDC085479]|uniref:IS3 family transposase n=1 Tax=Streptomyces sp. NPDC085479 TaxID=3365726 RepID=UPI0037D83389